MTRLYVFVEGQTEEAFVKHILAPDLRARGIWAIAILPGRGGGYWKTWLRTMKRVMEQQRGPQVRFTTLLDLYGLPRGFPDGRSLSEIANTEARVAQVEQSIADQMGDSRLIPYVQRHEFEALVLAGLDEIDWIFDDPRAAAGLAALRREVSGLAPEDINDGAMTAPSKRLARHIPSYDKVIHGEMAIGTVGLPRLCGACPRFGEWVERLRALGAAS